MCICPEPEEHEDLEEEEEEEGEGGKQQAKKTADGGESGAAVATVAPQVSRPQAGRCNRSVSHAGERYHWMAPGGSGREAGRSVSREKGQEVGDVGMCFKEIRVSSSRIEHFIHQSIR